MAPIEVMKLKDQLYDLFGNSFIRYSILPCGVPLFFVKNNDGSMLIGIDFQ